MSRFDFTGKLDFEEVDLTPAEQVIENIGYDFSAATRNIIRIGIEPYAGKITKRQPNFATSIAELFQRASSSHAMQSELGKRGEEVNQFEVFLYTPSFPEYRFRMMFVRYGVANYPAEIILEQGIAEACFANYMVLDSMEPIFNMDSRLELESFVENVLKSEYILRVMQELIRVDQLQRFRMKQEKEQERLEKLFASDAEV